MSHLLTIIFYQPILNLLIWLYNVVPGHDIGIAIILLTIIIRAALLPLSKKAIESQKSLQDLQPKMEELKKKYADNKQELGKATLDLYRENKINPFSSCLPILIQLPFLIAVYRVFMAGLKNGSMDLLYSFVQKPETINTITIGFLDLSKPNWVIAVLAGLAQFWQAKMIITKKPPAIVIKDKGALDENMASMMNKQMLYFMPALTVFIGLSLPGGLSLYWLVVTIITALQQVLIFNKILKKPAPEKDIAPEK
ncbi:MAG: YidC/Oxa1 family membrane protein insertase [Patescibacteria group bacterium]|jgi:YidC/Oxa1 family membrane protein insertase